MGGADYSIHPELQLVVTHFDGVVDDQTFVPLYRRIFADPGYVLGTNELADLRRVSRLALSHEAMDDVRILTEHLYADSGRDFRTVIVAPTDLSFGLGRMYEMLSEDGPERVTVVRRIEEALDVLGLDALPPPGGPRT